MLHAAHECEIKPTFELDKTLKVLKYLLRAELFESVYLVLFVHQSSKLKVIVDFMAPRLPKIMLPHELSIIK